METICYFNCLSLPTDLFIYETLPLQHSGHDDHHETLADQYVIEQPLLSESHSPSETSPGSTKDEDLEGSSNGAGVCITTEPPNEATRTDAAEVSSNSPCEEQDHFSYSRSRSSWKTMSLMCLSSRMRLYILIIFYLL